ncbi:MAG: TetR/AcrR family transcriptional regulator [Rhodospirillaceae bacterium]
MSSEPAPRKRLSREEARAVTRQRLLESAAQLFARHGYGGAAVDSIAEAAGYSKGAFYSNFESKEAIFLELLTQHMQTQRASLEQVIATGGDNPMAAVKTWLTEQDKDRNWSLLSMELQLHALRTPAFAEVYQRFRQEQCAAFGPLTETLFRKEGKTPPLPPALLAECLCGMADGITIATMDRTDLSIGPILSLFLEGLLAGAEPIDAPAQEP